MIRIFSKERVKLTSDIPTYIVKWTTYKYKFSDYTHPYVKEHYQAFTNYDEAIAFKNALNDAMDLLKITSLPQATISKQE